MNEENHFEDEKARNWAHKQKLDSLLTFKEKFEYWKKDVCKNGLQFGAKYSDEPAFSLKLEPQTDDDQRQLHKFWLDYYRDRYAKESLTVKKFASRQDETEIEKFAYYVIPIENLIRDLKNRLSAAKRQLDLLKRELEDVTERINKVAREVNGVVSSHAGLIKKLRLALETNQTYDILLTGYSEPIVEIVDLAMVWDIVHYEAYLKDTIAEVESNPKLRSQNNNFSTTSRTQEAYLVNLFDHVSKYRIVMELLVEKKCCQTGTYIWVDRGSGYKNTIVGIIKHLHAQGFYKSNKMPTSKEIVLIAKDTFGVDLSLDTVKRARPSMQEFDFIKPASTYNTPITPTTPNTPFTPV